MYVFILCVFAELFCFGYLQNVCAGMKPLLGELSWIQLMGCSSIMCLLIILYECFCVVSWEMLAFYWSHSVALSLFSTANRLAHTVCSHRVSVIEFVFLWKEYTNTIIIRNYLLTSLYSFYNVAHKSPKGWDKKCVDLWSENQAETAFQCDYPRVYVFIQPLSALL